MVVLTRIDDRLIHGQVVEGWVNYLKATCIVVADDQVASNPLQRSIMEISVPRGLKVSIRGVDEICALILSGSLDAERVILLFSRPADVAHALKAGLQLKTVNVGGMHFVSGKRKLMDVLAVDDTDVKAFREISSYGVAIDIQTVPTRKPQPLEKVFRACDVA